MGNFRKLIVWQMAKELAVRVYKYTSEGAFSKDYGLRDQIRKAAVSVPSNISEGDESGSNKQSIRYFNIAKGSLAEVQTQNEIAFEIGYLTREQYDDIEHRCNALSIKLLHLIKSRMES